MASTIDEFLAERQRTYQGFKRLTVWSTAAVLIVLALMAIFLV